MSTAVTDAQYRTLTSYQSQADQLMGQGDPHGAAITISKAALLASQLVQEVGQDGSRQIVRTLASFFRTQEHAYRAIALYQQSGSQPPASSGVCQTLAQSLTQYSQTSQLLQSVPEQETALWRNLTQLKEWEELLGEIKIEFGCDRSPGPDER